jgi:hypothetical protein
MKRLAPALLGALALSLLWVPSAGAAVSLSFAEAKHEAPVVHRNDEEVGYSVRLRNSGTSASSGTTSLTIALPAGMQLVEGTGNGWSCHLAALTCTTTEVINPGGEYARLTLLTWAFPNAPNTVLASFVAYGGSAGGDALASDSFSFAAAVPFGLNGFIAGACEQPAGSFEPLSCPAAEEHGAGASTQAGGHPFAASLAFALNGHLSARGESPMVGQLRDLFTGLPAGFIGNPEVARPLCTVTQVRESSTTEVLCPESAAVGGIGINVRSNGTATTEHESTPIYRVVPEKGYAAAFATRASDIAGKFAIVFRVKVRSNGDYGVSVISPLPPQSPEVVSVRYATLCGYGARASTAVPGTHIPTFTGCKLPGTSGANTVPFLTNPTSCPGSSPITTATADSYQEPGATNAEGLPDLSDPRWKTSEATAPPITGCNHLEFEPSFEGRPTTDVADAPSGLDFRLHLPQQGLTDRHSLAEAHLKDTTVVLPEGMSVNPSAATGLEACTSKQIGLTTPIGSAPVHFSGLPDECPDASKLGTVEVTTPILEKPLQGFLYLGKQYDNPFHSLLALYISIHDPETGIVAKFAGKVTPDPVTGQLTTTFEENPQVPLEEVKLQVFNGARASLRTPATCGPKATTATFTPWSAPESGPPAVRSDEFETSVAPGGGPCPTSAAQLPNAPRFTAGTIAPQAGAYSPFVLRLAREDGSQEIKGIGAVLPPGLTGRLAGTARCSEAQIARARSRNEPGEGALEQAHPSCPAGSELGPVYVTAGAGPSPFATTAHAYLAGPYKGAPISMVVIAPAVAGPFDLGTVTVRSALYIDPTTAQVSVKSDPIPTMLQGIPLDVRSVEVRVSRDRFTLNPTSCDPSQVSAQAFGLATVASLTQRFQVGECSALAFKPKLRVKLRGGAKRGDYQQLTATVTYPEGPGYANIASASVALPHSEFLAQEHIRTICTRVQFAAEQCPPGSIYGHAEAITPLLEEPLKGNVYLRSSSNPLPDLVVALKGPESTPIEVDLDGRTDSVHGGIRNTFEVVPDAPVSRFSLHLLGGRKSLIVNSRGLCGGVPARATAIFTAQDGARRELRPVVGNDCPKANKRRHGKS